MSHARFQKQQREKARREKAAAKRERRTARAEEADATDGASEPVTAEGESKVLADLAALHEEFERGGLEFDEFEERKRDLIAQLDV